MNTSTILFALFIFSFTLPQCSQNDAAPSNPTGGNPGTGNNKSSDPKYIYLTNHMKGTIEMTDGNKVTELAAPGGAPSGIAMSADKKLFVSNEQNKTLSEFSLDGTLIGEVFGNVGATYTGLAIGPDKQLYVAQTDGSYGKGLVERYDLITHLAKGSSFADDQNNAAFTPLNNASYFEGIAFGPDSNLYCASKHADVIAVYQGPKSETPGAFIHNISGVSKPTGLTFGPDSVLYVVEYNNSVIKRYNGSSFDVFINHNLSGPVQMAFAKDGYIYVTNADGANIVRFEGLSSSTPGKFFDTYISLPGAPVYMVMSDEK